MIAEQECEGHRRVIHWPVSILAIALFAVLFAAAAPARLAAADQFSSAGSDCLRWSQSSAERPLIDAHLHYNSVDAAERPPDEVIELFDRYRIMGAVVSGRPAALQALHRAGPRRVLPFLSLYQAAADKQGWMRDAAVPDRAVRLLDTGVYTGIGELHIFAEDRESPVLASLVDLAVERGLVLLVHGDAEVIQAIFSRAPGSTVLWAHLGTDPRPEVIGPMLEHYPRLFVDTSVRDGRFTDDDGCLLDEWRRFFVAYADQVLVGVDTHWPPRWDRFGEVVAEIRGWLAQLPDEVGDRLAYRNAARLFNLDGAKIGTSRALGARLVGHDDIK